MPAPRLSAVVVHWRDEAALAELTAAWPSDERLELIVVDNSATLAPSVAACLVDPGRNLGFAGGVNRGLAAARGEWVLLLNPDVRPADGALEGLLDALEQCEAAGLVPALVSPDGSSQARWQLRPLPSPFELWLQALFLAGVHGPRVPPPAGTPIPQPAGAALVLRRAVLEELGGLDEGYFPAWFEDVDLARRLAAAGHRLLYAPQVRLVHRGGGSLPALGYGPFLWIYYRNLSRYLGRHHGRAWALAVRLTLPWTALLRALALPLRRPRRSSSRRSAAVGLGGLLAGAVSGWRRPRGWAERFTASGRPSADA